MTNNSINPPPPSGSGGSGKKVEPHVERVKVFDPYPHTTNETTWEKLGRRVEYRNLSDVDFNALQDDEIKIPKDLADTLYYDDNSSLSWEFEKKWKWFSSLPQFNNLFLDQARQMGYPLRRIQELSVKDTVEFIADVVVTRLVYLEVDTNEAFIAKYGRHLSMETYFKLGLGDCDKFTSIYRAAFILAKRLNPRLKNVHITSSGLGGFDLPHIWNALVFVYPDHLVVSHIDSTFYDYRVVSHIDSTPHDNRESLEAKKGWHIPSSSDSDDFLFRFYEQVDPLAIFDMAKERLYSRDVSNKDKAGFLDRIGSALVHSSGRNFKQLMEEKEKLYASLDVDRNLPLVARLEFEVRLSHYAGDFVGLYRTSKRLAEIYRASPKAAKYIETMLYAIRKMEEENEPLPQGRGVREKREEVSALAKEVPLDSFFIYLLPDFYKNEMNLGRTDEAERYKRAILRKDPNRQF